MTLAQKPDRGGSPEDRSFFDSVRGKAAVSVVIGGSTLLASLIGKFGVPSSLLLALLMGGTSLIFQVLMDFEATIRHLEQRFIADFSEASSGFGILNSARQAGYEPERLQSLFANLQLLKQERRLLHKLVTAQFDTQRALCEALANQKIYSMDGLNREILIGLAEGVEYSIDAVSLYAGTRAGAVLDNNLWASYQGDRYLKKQRKATERRVAVRRIFGYDSADQSVDLDGLRLLATKQAEHGVDVRILDVANHPEVRNSFMDFVIFDDQVEYDVKVDEVQVSSSRQPGINTHLRFDQDFLQDQVTLYSSLWDAAFPFIDFFQEKIV